MGHSKPTVFRVVATLVFVMAILSNVFSPSEPIVMSEIQASKLGDYLKNMFSGLAAPRSRATQPGEIGRPEEEDPFKNYQPGPPPGIDEMGNGNEISDAFPENTVRVDRFGMCRMVSNLRPDLGIAIPHLSAVEWQSFIEHPPQGVTLAACAGPGPTPTPTPPGPTPTPVGLCGRDVDPTEIYSVIGNVRLDFQPVAPMAGVAPRISAGTISLNFICQAMGCGPPEWMAYRTYSSPENNAIVRWTGTEWRKFPATAEPTKMDGCPETQERMLRCKAPGQPAGPIQRRNCD